jgi:DNA-binding NarL/FixJ family response regulator
MLRDITERKQTEEALRKRESELLLQKSRLEEVNTALKVLLERRELDKSELEENVLSNVKQLVLPYLEKLKSTQLEPYQMTLVSTLESHLTEIVSPFVTELSSRFLNLTPTQIQVANLIKDGRTSKEIASLLNLSENTILSYRYRIRSKLGLKNTKTNLRSYLLSLHD